MLRADIDGLSALAASCQEQAGALAASGSLSSSAGEVTPTAVAVRIAHADVASAATRFTRRMQANAERFSATAAAFAATEEDSSSALASVTGTA